MKYRMPLVILIVLIGCMPEPRLTLTKVGMVRYGMSSVEVDRIFDVGPAHVFKWHSNDEMTRVEHYQIFSGSYQNDYFLYFQNSKLIFWGYPHEFSRSSNIKYHKILQISLDRLRVAKKLENMTH
jgi:hypothetical protein